MTKKITVSQPDAMIAIAIEARKQLSIEDNERLKNYFIKENRLNDGFDVFFSP